MTRHVLCSSQQLRASNLQCQAILTRLPDIFNTKKEKKLYTEKFSTSLNPENTITAFPQI